MTAFTGFVMTLSEKLALKWKITVYNRLQLELAFSVTHTYKVIDHFIFQGNRLIHRQTIAQSDFAVDICYILRGIEIYIRHTGLSSWPPGQSALPSHINDVFIHMNIVPGHSHWLSGQWREGGAKRKQGD